MRFVSSVSWTLKRVSKRLRRVGVISDWKADMLARVRRSRIDYWLLD